MSTYVMPDPGEGILEAEIVTWRVAVGDSVRVNDVIVEVETAKSLVELPSPWDGVITARFGAIGETVSVGSPLVEIATAEISAPEPFLVGYGPNRPNQNRGASDSPSNNVPASTENLESPPPTLPTPQLEPLATNTQAKPRVRRLARDAGVNLDDIIGTGPGNTVTREDVLQAAFIGSPKPETRVTLTGLRKGMAHTMTAALDVPHASVWCDVDLTETVKLVAALRDRREFAQVKVGPLLIFAKAVCLALMKYPDLNSSFDPNTNELVLKHQINLGIAASTPKGLVVPNIKAAGEMTLIELAESLASLVQTARSGGLTPTQTTGGTFTITNVGVFGIDSGTPILNFGETGIACFGAIRPRPWVIDDRIEVRQVATIALAFDHRVIDGETGSRFLADVAAILHGPGLAMLF